MRKAITTNMLFIHSLAILSCELKIIHNTKCFKIRTATHYKVLKHINYNASRDTGTTDIETVQQRSHSDTKRGISKALGATRTLSL